MAKTKRPKREWEKTIKDLSASECVGSLKLIHILHRTLLSQLKKRIELEKPAEVDNGVSTSAFSLAEAPDSPELQR